MQALRMVWDGTPKADTWSPVPVFVYEPTLKAGDFYNADSSYLIASPRATEILRVGFGLAGEILPLYYQNQEYSLINITHVIDCLDHERTIFKIHNGTRVWISKYVFNPRLIPDDRLFKIPEENSIFVAEGLIEWEFEFKNMVQNENLDGLIFREVWRD